MNSSGSNRSVNATAVVVASVDYAGICVDVCSTVRCRSATVQLDSSSTSSSSGSSSSGKRAAMAISPTAADSESVTRSGGSPRRRR